MPSVLKILPDMVSFVLLESKKDEGCGIEVKRN